MLSIVTDPLQASINKNQIMSTLSNNYQAILISIISASVVILTIYWTSKYYQTQTSITIDDITNTKTKQTETNKPIQSTHNTNIIKPQTIKHPTNKPIPIQKQSSPSPQLVSSPNVVNIESETHQTIHTIKGIPEQINFSSVQKNVSTFDYRSSEGRTPFQTKFTPFDQEPVFPPNNNGFSTIRRRKNTVTTIVYPNKEPITIKETTIEHIDIPIMWSPFLHGLRYAVAQDQGIRRHMENSTSIVEMEGHNSNKKNKNGKTYSFSLFDGHLGDEAAKFCTEYLHKYVADIIDDSDDDDISGSIRKAFHHTDDMFKEYALNNECEAGAVGVYVYYQCNAKDNDCDCIYVANVGDCRAILCSKGKVSILTEDHNPKNESEKKRCGNRIDAKAELLSGQISVTRAIGDYHTVKDDTVAYKHKKLDGLICDPHIIKHKLDKEDEFLIIACDGLWDVMDSKNAMQSCRRSLRRDGDVTKAAQRLIKSAQSLTSQHNLDFPNKSNAASSLTADNISVMVIGFANKEGHIGPKQETLSRRRCRRPLGGFKKTSI